MDSRKNTVCQKPDKKKCQRAGQYGRREFLKGAARAAAFGGSAMLAGCGGSSMLGSKEELSLRWKEYFKKHYRLMENLAEFVTRPQRWHEDAEFYHLEEY